MNQPNNPHEEPGLSPLEFARLQEQLQQRNAQLAAANAALRASERELEERVAARTRELTTLLRVSNNITTTLQLDALLGLILDQLQEVVAYKLASITLLEGDELVILAVRGEGMQPPGTRLPLREHVNTRNMLAERKPAFVPDLTADTALAQRMRENLAHLYMEGLGSWMSAPLVFREQSIGGLALAHGQAGYYNAARVDLAMAFANQAAATIVNARLYEQTRHLATLQERQRLARELHDSVSQALYGIVLGARTARSLLERDPRQAVEPLDYILSLSEAGLAEMRALIFELRPEALRVEGLIPALQKLANALSARHQLQVAVQADVEPDIALDLKEALYRIAQEATHNISKHAGARRVEICLLQQAGEVRLRISDDGVGFQTEQDYPGHLGLHTMRERAEQLGGTFQLVSLPAAGTQIEVRFPL